MMWARRDCGRTCRVNLYNFRKLYTGNGSTKSCGCLLREKRRLNGTLSVRHGGCRGKINHVPHWSPEYTAYCGAKGRCRDKSNKDYGGRGIQFLFTSFEQWLAELGPKPEPKELYSVDRIRNEGNYQVGNVRWATREMQQSNRRSK